MMKRKSKKVEEQDILYGGRASVRVLFLAEAGTMGLGKVQTKFGHQLHLHLPFSTMMGSPRCPP